MWLELDNRESNVPEYIINLKETMIKYNFQLNHIIVTHRHKDHLGGVNDVLNMITSKNKCKVWKYVCENEKKRDYEFSFNVLENKQLFHTDGATLKIHHTPGHTADHIVITLEEEKALFSADCVLGEGTTIFEDLSEYLKSLHFILDLNPAVIYPGHGSVIKDPIKRVNEYIKHRLKRETEIYNIINESPDKSMTIDDITNVIYKNTSGDLLKVAEYSVQVHLNKLMKDCKVVKNNNKWIIEK